MTQKEIFEKIYNIVLFRGSESAINALNKMYHSYMQNNNPKSIDAENVSFIRNELVDVFKGAQSYKDNINYRGPTELDLKFFDKQKISKGSLVQDLSIVENRDTIFYNKIVVITGVFSRYPVRDELASALKKLGADINTTISKKTNIVCLGWDGVGPAKMQKVTELIATGHDIKLIKEDELYNILKSALLI